MKNKSKVKVGVVMVFAGFFAHALDIVTGEFEYVKALRALKQTSEVQIDVIQVPLFPGHLMDSGFHVISQLFAELMKLVDEVVAVLMLTTNPLDPKNKDAAIETLRNGLVQAGRLGVRVCSATSLEAWMDGFKKGLKPLTGSELDDAVDLLVDIHVQAIRKAKAQQCTVKYLDIEYLRTVEYTTFTNMEIAYRVIKTINDKLGYVFCRLLDDTAHAEDSGLSIEIQKRVRQQAKKDGAYGTSHASSPTSRGVLTQAVVQGVRAMHEDGNLQSLMVEIFDPKDPVLQPMRDHITGFGQQRIYDIIEAMVDGLKVVESELSVLATKRRQH
jgi:hypothetical protein